MRRYFGYGWNKVAWPLSILLWIRVAWIVFVLGLLVYAFTR
jgi:hypothetical protein